MPLLPFKRHGTKKPGVKLANLEAGASKAAEELLGWLPPKGAAVTIPF